MENRIDPDGDGNRGRNGWTEMATMALESLWLWGHGSGVIAATLEFPTRNAVMGKINRMGLMGRRGERLGASFRGAALHVDFMVGGIGQITGTAFDWDHEVDRAILVLVAALLVGHDAETISSAISRPRDEVGRVLDAAAAARIWVPRCSPPASWWHPTDGAFELLLDAMVTTGQITFEQKGGERLYSLPSKHNPNNETGASG